MQHAGTRGSEPATDAAAALVGRWTWFHRTAGTGSNSRQITIHPDGRYEYTATTMIADLPVDVDPTSRVTGRYRIEGNVIYAVADNGQRLSLRFALLEGGRVLILDGQTDMRE
jgi:hypothetical protein